MDNFHYPDIALLLARFALGYMFAASGFHKLFVRERHEKLVHTLTTDHIPIVWAMQWWIPLNEFAFGVLVILGIGTEFSAAVLGLISLVALIVDGLPRIKVWGPLNKCDYLCCLLYLPETLLGILALIVIMSGPGRFIV